MTKWSSLFLAGIVVLGVVMVASSVSPVYAASTASPIKLYYHNETSSPLIAGWSNRPWILNSSAAWSLSPQLWPPSAGSFQFVFYVAPDLAGDVSINGTIVLHPWVSGNTTGGSTPSASFSLTIYEVSSSGFIWSDSSSGPGSLTLDSTPTDVNTMPQNSGKLLKYQVTSHTFGRGNSIAILVDVQPQGSTTARFYYDHFSTPSRVIVFSESHAAPDSLWYTDEFGNPSTVFIARDKGVLTVNALVTDPFGTYDIAFPTLGDRTPNILMDLVAPNGIPVLANASMVAVRGLPSAFNGTVSYTLRIPDMAGTHIVTVRVRDNSGNVFPLTASLAIVEGFPLTVTVVDAGGQPVSGAWVQIVTSNDVPYDFKLTNGSGIAVFKVPKGTYEIRADFSTTYLLTQFSTSKETQAQAANAPVSVTLTLSDYPLPFTSTVLFLIVLIVAAAVVATSVFVLATRRMGMEGISKSLSSAVSRIRPRKVEPAPKFCIYCGSSLKSGATVCASCGRIVPVMRL